MELSTFLYCAKNHQILTTCLKKFLDNSDCFVLRLVCKDFNQILIRKNNSNKKLENFLKKKGYYYLHSNLFKPNFKKLFFIAFSPRDEIVQKQLILDNLEHCKEKICLSAILRGNIKLLKWAKENNCPWDEWVFHYSALSGNLETMKWLKENNCPWDKLTFYYTALSETVRNAFSLKENSIWNQSTRRIKTKNETLENMKWLKENNCPWDEKVFHSTVSGGNLENIKWLKENNCPYNKETCLKLTTNNNVIKEWVINNL